MTVYHYRVLIETGSIKRLADLPLAPAADAQKFMWSGCESEDGRHGDLWEFATTGPVDDILDRNPAVIEYEQITSIRDQAAQVNQELDELSAWWERDQEPEQLPNVMKNFQAFRAAGHYSNEWGLAGKLENDQFYLADGKGFVHYAAIQGGEATHHEWRSVDFETYKAAFRLVRKHQFSREEVPFPMWVDDIQKLTTML